MSDYPLRMWSILAGWYFLMSPFGGICNIFSNFYLKKINRNTEKTAIPLMCFGFCFILHSLSGINHMINLFCGSLQLWQYQIYTWLGYLKLSHRQWIEQQYYYLAISVYLQAQPPLLSDRGLGTLILIISGAPSSQNAHIFITDPKLLIYCPLLIYLSQIQNQVIEI